MAGAPSSYPTLPDSSAYLPRHPAPVLDRQARLATYSWLWAASLGASARPAAAVATPAFWRDIAALAEGHGVAALVLGSARELAAAQGMDGSDGFAALADAAGRTLARGQRLAGDQAAVTAGLAAAGLPFAWMKGAWIVGAGLYPNAAARPRADLDLYLPEGHWTEVAAALRALGYQPAQRSWKHAVWLNANHRVVDLRGEHPDNPRPLELHDRLGEGFRGLRLDLDPERALPHRGQQLPDGVALAHLAAHSTVAMLERRLRLVQLLDLRLLAARLAPAEAARLLRAGAAPQAARFLWPSLALAARLSPAPALQHLADDLETAVPRALRGWLAGQDLDSLSWPGRLEARRSIGEIPSIWPLDAAERRGVWRAILLPPPELLADRYPQLAAEGRHAAMAALHVGFTLRQALRRWRQRPRQG